ncbi:MAG TPA: hypothetical protein VF193_05770 [Steroidobacter sp.]
MHPIRAFLVALPAALVAAAGQASAFEVERSVARYSDRRFHYELEVELDAPLEQVLSVLQDYESYPSLDERILEARVLERPEEHVAMLKTLLRVCFGFFCRNVSRIERVEESPDSLVAIADPERSDVEFGETRTALSESEDGGTLVRYSTTIIPGFWVPRFVGRRWLLRTLEEATRDLFMNVEREAKEVEEGQGGGIATSGNAGATTEP